MGEYVTLVMQKLNRMMQSGDFIAMISVDANFNCLAISRQLEDIDSLLSHDNHYGLVVKGKNGDLLFTSHNNGVRETAKVGVGKFQLYELMNYLVEDVTINSSLNTPSIRLRNNETIETLSTTLESKGYKVWYFKNKPAHYVNDWYGNEEDKYYTLTFYVDEFVFGITTSAIVIPYADKAIVIHSPSRNIDYETIKRFFLGAGLDNETTDFILESV